MPDKPENKRKRMVVEEVDSDAPKNEAPSEKSPVSTEPVEEIKEKVTELQSITEHMAGDVEKSAEVQEDLAKAAEEVTPQAIPEPNIAEAQGNRKGEGPNPLIIIVPGIFLLGALLGGIWFYQKGINKISISPSPESQTTSNSSTSPSASPSAQVNLSKYAINVQNGSGIPGSASTAKDLLTQAGFTVSGTGNAGTFDFTNTIIETKSDVPQAFIDKLTKTLSAAYQVGSPKTLPDSSTDEVVVIVGSSKAQ